MKKINKLAAATLISTFGLFSAGSAIAADYTAGPSGHWYVEGLVGGVAGTVLGVILWRTGMISAPAIPGVTAGLGLGSWFNAWRRARNAEKDKGGPT